MVLILAALFNRLSAVEEIAPLYQITKLEGIRFFWHGPAGIVESKHRAMLRFLHITWSDRHHSWPGMYNHVNKPSQKHLSKSRLCAIR